MFAHFLKAFSLLDARNRFLAVLLLFVIVAGSGLEAVGVAVVFPLIKLIGDPGSVEGMPVLGWAFRAIQPFSHGDFLILLTVGILALFLFKNMFLLFSVYWQNWFVFRNQAHATRALLYGYLTSPYAMHLQRNSSELIRNITESLPPALSAVMIGAFTLIAELLIVLLVAAILFTADPAVALFAIVVIGLGMALLYFLLRRRVRDWGWEKQELIRKRLQCALQALNGVKDVKVLNREKAFSDIFYDAAYRLARTMTKINIASEIPRLSIELVMVGTVTGLILFTLAQEQTGKDIMPLLGLYGAASLRLVSSVNRMLPRLYTIQSMLPGLDRVYADFEAFAHHDAGPAPETTPEGGEFATISLEGVSFSYPDVPGPALDGIDLTIRKGESIGLTGSSGAGKTTLGDLILGLHTPTGGTLRVDGVPVSAERPEWRARFGYVPQSVYLLDDTIRRNIALGLADDLIDGDALREAVRMAHLDDFLAGLPQGLDSVVGEQGVRLSGGQRQRIGIARALYRRPEILILDEATSALDTETEQVITAAIDGLKGSKTLLVIAHRLSTIRSCDRVVFMDKGRIAASGKFDAVAAANSDFRHMVTLAGLQTSANGEAGAP